MSDQARPAVLFDPGLVDSIAAQLDLRQPNADALRTVALRLSQFYEKPREPQEYFEGVVDSATGVGKTYIIAALIDYYAALGFRNFAVITPGQTILEKTIDQFTRGTRRSLLDSLATQPIVIHSGNFATAQMAAEMANPARVKLFVFTVQSLLRPDQKRNRKTHTFQEGLGGAFYQHLEAFDDLLVLADEHHTYHGDRFSQAIRGLTPFALIGLTATPDERRLARDNIPIVYRYPLAAAIGERFVKTPVIVGRKDDRTDERTQLRDAGALLRAKQAALDAYCAARELPPVHAVMLVTSRDTEHAAQTVAFLRSDQYFNGTYGGDQVVLEVHSNADREQALAAFDGVDEPDSPTRIIVQVGMLKEGWDCKSVYVIVSLRSSVSEVLTEQTLGRGLRLPFGRYTDQPLLDELDVVAHERYSQLLARSNVLTEAFIDHRTVIHQTGAGDAGAPDLYDGHVQAPVAESPDGTVAGATEAIGRDSDGFSAGVVTVTATEDRVAAAERVAEAAPKVLEPRFDTERIEIPQMRVIAVPSDFSVTQITDEPAFRDLGFKLAADPDPYLRRTSIGAQVTQDYISGVRTVVLNTYESAGRVEATSGEGDIAEIKSAIVREVIGSSRVPSREGAPAAVGRLLEAVLTGAGDKADTLLLRYPKTLARALADAIAERARAAARTQVQRVIRGVPFRSGPRHAREAPTADRHGRFKRGHPYTGWTKSLYEQEWFDSSAERAFALIADAADEVTHWIRLQRGDLPILWHGAERTYHPDFLVLCADGTRWVAEVKSDRELPTAEVQAKRAEALTWANEAGTKLGQWGYLLAAERDLEACRGDWNRLVQLTRP